MTVADKIAEWLHEKGITHAFGVIGAGNAAIFDAVARLAKTQIVCTHHEQAAVLAACGYFRVSGRISAALVTTGAGSTNAVTGVVSAYMDSTPVLVISGNEASKYIGAHTRVWGVQGYDSVGMVAGCTKWAARSQAGTPVTAQLEIALENAMSPRQGPVWLDIPKDIQTHAA